MMEGHCNKYAILREGDIDPIDLIGDSVNAILVEDEVMKWYCLWMIDPNTKKPIKLHDAFDDFFDCVEGVDNYYFPNSVVQFAKMHNIKIDYMSYTAICLRFLEDNTDNYIKIPDEYLPTYDDLKSVLVGSNGVSIYFHLYPEYNKLECVCCLYSIKNTKPKLDYDFLLHPDWDAIKKLDALIKDSNIKITQTQTGFNADIPELDLTDMLALEKKEGNINETKQ